jgi:hypothetical protein
MQVCSVTVLERQISWQFMLHSVCYRSSDWRRSWTLWWRDKMILLTAYSIGTSALLRLPWDLVVSCVPSDASGGTVLFFLRRINELHVTAYLFIADWSSHPVLQTIMIAKNSFENMAKFEHLGRTVSKLCLLKCKENMGFRQCFLPCSLEYFIFPHPVQKSKH